MMNEEFNPYLQQQSEEPARSYAQQPPYQQQAYQPQQQYQQPVYQPQYQQPVIYQQQMPYLQPMYPRQPRQILPGYGAAKAFAIVSFAAGFISLLGAFIIFIATFVMSATNSYGTEAALLSASHVGISYSIVFAVPGLIFGILSLVKRSRLFALGLIGTICHGLLILATVYALLTYAAY